MSTDNPPPRDWAAETAELIDRTVGNVRDRVVVPAESAGRSLVMGTVAGVIGVALALILMVAVFRALVLFYNTITPGADDNAWMAWMTIGGIHIAAGVFVWTKRTVPAR